MCAKREQQVVPNGHNKLCQKCLTVINTTKYTNCFLFESGKTAAIEYDTKQDAVDMYLKDSLDNRKFTIVKSIVAGEGNSIEMISKIKTKTK